LISLAGWINQQQQFAIDYLRERIVYSRNSLAADDFVSMTISVGGSPRRPKE
jgi:hypothetical protein